MAGGTNVGNMSATLSLSAFEFMNGLKQSEEAAREFSTVTTAEVAKANTAMMSVGKTGFNGGNAARMIQQGGFALQDFTSQLDTRGLSGAFAAISNNLQVMGAGFGPVGMAVSSVGGALAGLLLPKLIEASGLFKDAKKEADSFTEALKHQNEMIKYRKDNEKALMAGGTEELNSRQEKRKEELDTLQKQYAAMKQQRDLQAQLLQNDKEASIAASNTFMGMGRLGLNPQGSQGKLDAAQQQMDQAHAEINRLKQGMSIDESLRPKVEKADKARSDDEELMKSREEAAKAEEYIRDFRQKGLESYGDEWHKLIEKQKHDRKEFEDKSAGANKADVAAARDQLAMNQEIDRQKLKISEREKLISKLGHDNGMSAGADLASKEGIKAINVALNGPGEKSIQEQQLKVEEEQLKALQAMAGMNPEDRAAVNAMSKGEATLGEAVPMGGMSRGESLSPSPSNPIPASEANPEVYETINAKRNRQGISDYKTQDVLQQKYARESAAPSNVEMVVQAKREREGQASQQLAEQTKIMQDQKRLMEEANRKPTTKVVSLSG